ncbi:MAG: ABC transporter ATP-binding protein [Patescibacteria group bacterium]
MPNLHQMREFALLVGSAFRGYEKVFVVTTFLGIVGGILGGIGIGVLIPLFSYLTGGIPAGGRMASLMEGLFDTLHIPLEAPYLLAFMFTVFVAKAVILFFASHYGERMAETYEENTKKALFAGILKAKWPYLLEQKTGHVERFIMTEANRAGQVIFEMSALILVVTSLIIYLAAAFLISIKTTLIVLALGSLLFFFLRGFYASIQNISQELVEAEKEAAHYITEHVSGVKTVKALAAEEGASRKAFTEFSRIFRSRMRMVFYKLFATSFFEPMSFIFIGIVFLTSYRAPGFALGSFVAVIYVIQKLFGFLQSFQSKLQVINTYIPSLRGIVRYRDALSEAAEQSGGILPFSFEKTLTFKGVGFGYGTTRILDGLSFEIRKGETVGIIGPSGSGKTTVADLLLRLLNPQKGAIQIDGKDIGEVAFSSWRQNVGYVSQDVFLLNDTIENNIRFYDGAIDSEGVRGAAERANMLSTIEKLPEGFQTIVGERGVKLSGGQRQRIAIARALVRNPHILILDEATSALDNESERAVQETLAGIRGSVTIVMIAHRISTIQDADRVIALDKGIIVESGSPDALMKNEKSYFRKMSLLSSREETT